MSDDIVPPLDLNPENNSAKGSTPPPAAPTPPAPLQPLAQVEKKPMVQPEGLAVDIYYNPDRLNAMIAYARQMVASKAFGGNAQNEFQALAILQTGAEMGLAPMEAFDSFYIIKGKIVMYGAAMTRQLKRHGWKIEYLDEEPGKKVTVKITKGEEDSLTVTSADPVLGRSVAYKNDPFSKLRWHALARVLRFHAADAMGSVSQLVEDMDDSEVEAGLKNGDGTTTPTPAKSTRAKKKAFEVTTEENVDAGTSKVVSTDPPLPTSVDSDTGEIIDGETDEMPGNLDLK